MRYFKSLGHNNQCPNDNTKKERNYFFPNINIVNQNNGAEIIYVDIFTGKVNE
jgi:hypothetical protein